MFQTREEKYLKKNSSFLFFIKKNVCNFVNARLFFTIHECALIKKIIDVMKRMNSKLRAIYGQAALFFLLGGIFAACSSSPDLVKENKSEQYAVKFTADYNMKSIDTFHSDVKSVTLYAFDENGLFVTQKTDAGSQLSSKDYSMKLSIDPSKYHLITWASADDSFTAPTLTPGVSKLSDLKINAAASDDDKEFVNQKLASLYNGEVKPSTAVSRSGDTILNVPLLTSSCEVDIAVAMADEAYSRASVDPNQFSFEMSDYGSVMNYDGTAASSTLKAYQPYSLDGGTLTSSAVSRGNNVIYKTVVAKFNLLRLLLSRNPSITVKVNGTPLLLNINLMTYFKLVKAYLSMSLNEYLGRESKFTITFFVDKNMKLVDSVVMLNGYTINP